MVKTQGLYQTVKPRRQVLVLIDIEMEVSGVEHLADNPMVLDKIDRYLNQLNKINQPMLMQIFDVTSCNFPYFVTVTSPIFIGGEPFTIDLDGGLNKTSLVSSSERTTSFNQPRPGMC